MAGERLTKLTIRASFSGADNVRADQTEQVRLLLAGGWVSFTRGAYPNQRQFAVPDPDDVGGDFVLQGVTNLIAAIRLAIQQRGGLPYVVSEPRSAGTSLFTNLPQVDFDIEATTYEAANLGFEFPQVSPPGWEILVNYARIPPVKVNANITPATIFGSATGAIQLIAFEGTAPYTYTWADIGRTPDEFRTQLKAGSYKCVVADSAGASTTIVCVVKSDAQLSVLVSQTETSITLTVSGGLAPYTYQWDDGPTTAERLGLTAGTYACLVRDSRGASQRVVVSLEPYRYYWSQNPVRTTLDAGDDYRLDPSTKPNLSYLCEVWVEPTYLSGKFVQVGTQLEQPADAQGRTTFDVRALVGAFLKQHLPPAGTYVAARADSLFRRFYLKTAEKYGTPPAAAPLSSAQQHYVVLGGLSEEEAAAGNWFAYQLAAKPFLTWEPNHQKVVPQQPAFLYYQHLSAGSTFTVWSRARLADNSVSMPVPQATVAQVSRFEVYCLAVGPQPLGLTASEVAGYDVWVADAAGVPLSEVRHYVLDRSYYPQQRFFLYTNSLGGVNVLFAKGQAKLNLDVKAEEADRPGFEALLGDVEVFDRSGTPKLAVVTGNRRRGQVVADQEALLSRRVTLLKDGKYWPGRIEAASFVIKDEGEGLASLSFTFILPKQRHFTPSLPEVVAGQVVRIVAGGEGAQP